MKYVLLWHILIDELYRAKDKGINIKVIIDNNDKNNNSKLRIFNICNVLRIAEVRSKYKNIMHNKYCIIDNKIVIDGSIIGVKQLNIMRNI